MLHNVEPSASSHSRALQTDRVLNRIFPRLSLLPAYLPCASCIPGFIVWLPRGMRASSAAISWTRACRYVELTLSPSMPRHRARAWAAASCNTCSTELRSMVHLGCTLCSTTKPIGIELELPELGRRLNPEWLATPFGTMGAAAPRNHGRARSPLRDRMHRHGHDGRLFTTLRFDDRGPIHPPHHTICKANLVGSFIEVFDLYLRHGIQKFLRVLPFRHKALDEFQRRRVEILRQNRQSPFNRGQPFGLIDGCNLE